MKKFWIVLLILTLLASAGLGGLWWLLRSGTGPYADGGDGAILFWEVAGAYPEVRSDAPLAGVLGDAGPLQTEIVRALERAAEDKAIRGLFLEIHALPHHWAGIEELEAAVRVFAASGKPVHAWIASAGDREYQLALAADRLNLAPEGVLAVSGVSARLTYLAGTLEKLGMDADYVHVGRYKSAPETYERHDPSEASLEMLEAILDDRYDTLVTRTSASRGLSRDRVVALFDRGLLDAESALEQGLVDAVAYGPDAFETAFPGEESRALADYALYPKAERGPRVALVTVAGTIDQGPSRSGGWGGPKAGSWTLCERLRDCREDEDIHGVVLRIDSPGGSALASDLIWDEVRQLRDVKPVVVSMGGMAASGGYYVACAADSIFAEPGTLTGSIGVFAGKIARAGFYEKLGITHTTLSRGRNADLFGDLAPFDPGQRRTLQAYLDAFYDRFVAKVAAGRGLDPAAAEAASQGRVWTGRDAVDIGLVDGLGGLPRALDSLRRMIGAPEGGRLRIETFERRPGLLERVLASGLRRERGASATAVADLERLLPAGIGNGPVAAGLMDGRPLALCPVGVEFR